MSTSTLSPVFNTLVATLVPITAGIPNSRASVAACEVRPPRSVTIARTLFNKGIKTTEVSSVTRMLPFIKDANSCFFLISWITPRMTPCFPMSLPCIVPTLMEDPSVGSPFTISRKKLQAFKTFLSRFFRANISMHCTSSLH